MLNSFTILVWMNKQFLVYCSDFFFFFFFLQNNYPANRQDIDYDLIIFRNKLVLEVARHCGYSKVMMGNCGTQLAVRLLTDMAVGRGSHAAMETVSDPSAVRLELP